MKKVKNVQIEPRDFRSKSMSTVMDRLVLHHAAVDLMGHVGLSLPTAYRLFCGFAKVKRLNLITPERIHEVVGFAERVRIRQTTAEDWVHIEAGRKLLANPYQMNLF
jgi:hypothetical protein